MKTIAAKNKTASRRRVPQKAKAPGAAAPSKRRGAAKPPATRRRPSKPTDREQVAINMTEAVGFTQSALHGVRHDLDLVMREILAMTSKDASAYVSSAEWRKYVRRGTLERYAGLNAKMVIAEGHLDVIERQMRHTRSLEAGQRHLADEKPKRRT